MTRLNAFSSGKYGLKEYTKLKEYFPQIRRAKMYGRMIYYLDDKSKILQILFLRFRIRRL